VNEEQDIAESVKPQDNSVFQKGGMKELKDKLDKIDVYLKSYEDSQETKWKDRLSNLEN